MPRSTSRVTEVSATNMPMTSTSVTTIEVSSNSGPNSNGVYPTKELSIEELEQVSPDTDGDGVVNIHDNCPFVANPDQDDKNNDGIGDVCYVLELAKDDLAKRLQGNAAVLGIGIDQVTEVVWPDQCLGLPSERPCTAIETPGYRLILQVARAPGQKYLYHTDKLEVARFVGPVDDTR